jgi:hypothetical protein
MVRSVISGRALFCEENSPPPMHRRRPATDQKKMHRREGAAQSAWCTQGVSNSFLCFQSSFAKKIIFNRPLKNLSLFFLKKTLARIFLAKDRATENFCVGPIT